MDRHGRSLAGLGLNLRGHSPLARLLRCRFHRIQHPGPHARPPAGHWRVQRGIPAMTIKPTTAMTISPMTTMPMPEMMRSVLTTGLASPLSPPPPRRPAR